MDLKFTVKEISRVYFHVKQRSEKKNWSTNCDNQKLRRLKKNILNISTCMRRSISPQSLVVQVSAKSEISLTQGF